MYKLFVFFFPTSFFPTSFSFHREAEGKIENAEGKVQKKIGDIKDAAGK
jgi:hypothetical protein